MKNKKNPIKKNLEDLFEDLIPDKDAPEVLKKEVFQTLDTLSLTEDIKDKSTDKFFKTEIDILDLLPLEPLIDPELIDEEE